MSKAIQAALPWIVSIISAAIFIPGFIDYLRRKGRGNTGSQNRAKTRSKEEQSTWMMEGIALGMAAGYWIGRAAGNAVAGLGFGVLIGMFAGSKVAKTYPEKGEYNDEEAL